MATLSERRIQQVFQQAQLSLYVHERDSSYGEILEMVDEMVDLLIEVRRERAALQEIASRWKEAAAMPAGEGSRLLALSLCARAREALDLGGDELALSSLEARGGPVKVQH
jgi:hypothetical protein